MKFKPIDDSLLRTTIGTMVQPPDVTSQDVTLWSGLKSD